MADQKFTDEDPSVYKSHILYIVPGDANCDYLLRYLETTQLYDEVFIQDAKLLQRRPAWLDGVPILVSKKNAQAHKGRNIMQYIQNWRSDDLLPVSQGTGGLSEFNDGEASGQGFASLYGQHMFSMEEDDGQMPAPPPSGHQQQQQQGPTNEKQSRKQQLETENAMKLQQMMEARNQMDARLSQKNNRAGPVPRDFMQQSGYF